jgi:hypothetical protein
MRKLSYVCVVVVILISLVIHKGWAQQYDLGIELGISGFYGDLGGANYIGRPLFFDLEKTLMKPAAGLHFRYYFNRRISARTTFSYTEVAGDDKLIQPRQEFSPEWFRWYRNLNFQSHIIEGTFILEANLIFFEPGSKRYRFAPYVLGGLGLFHFNPQALYSGELIDLKPLRTEGQGFLGTGVQEYSLLQPVIPLGIGLRYNISGSIIFGLEYRTNFTFTDYVDDVSGHYVAQEDFNKFFTDPSTAALAYDLSVQSEGMDPDGTLAYITGPNQQRGDAKDKDHYFLMQVSFSYLLFNNNAAASGFNKRRMIYPRKVWRTDQMFKNKKF